MPTFHIETDRSLLITEDVIKETNEFCASRIRAFFNLEETLNDIIGVMNTLQHQQSGHADFSLTHYASSWVETYEYFAHQKGVLVSGSKQHSIRLCAERIIRQSNIHEKLIN